MAVMWLCLVAVCVQITAASLLDYPALIAMSCLSTLFANVGASMPMTERVNMVKDHITKTIADFDAGNSRDGVQTVQQTLLALLMDTSLADDQWVSVSKVGVHPDNRDKAGLVPIDVHDLLLFICRQGWSWHECKGALASEIPPTPIGDEWRKFNEQLALGSDGCSCSLA